MSLSLPETVHDFMDWPWERIAPYYDELAQRPLTPDTVDQWLKDWTQLTKLIFERSSRLSVAKTLNTADETAEAAFNAFLENIFPPSQAAEQRLRLRLLESGLEPDGMAVPLTKIRADVEMFREENLPLLAAERKLGSEYDKLVGAQTVEWAGQER
ncbi:MAG: M3 family oligoendopeptidase, partial [Anaerolineales bacterium]|nr:M3 family oligoendopeptidase [Anaerolineales bacterium]